MKNTIIVLVFSMLPFGIFAQANDRTKMEERLLGVLPDTVRAKLLNELSYRYQGEDYTKAYHYAQEAYRFTLDRGLQFENAVSVNRLAHSYWSQGRANEAITLLIQHFPKGQGEKWSKVITESYRLLGTAYFEFDNQLSQQYSQKALSLAKRNNDSLFITKVYLDIGMLMEYLGRYESSVNYLDSATRVAMQSRQRFILPVLRIRRLISEHELDRQQTPGMARRPNPGLIPKIETVIAQAEHERNLYAMAIALRFLSEIHYYEGNLQEAENAVVQSLEISSSLRLRELIRIGYRTMMWIKRARNEYKGAYEFQEKYYRISDSISNETKARQIALLEMRLEAEKSEHEIKRLTLESELGYRWKFALTGGIILLVAAISIIVVMNQATQKKSQFLLDTQSRLNAKLKETDEIKRRFFANISHEFKTPISLIVAPLEERISKATSPDEKKDLEMIKRNAGRLLSLINELLDLSKLEAGKLKLSVNPVEINAFIAKIASSFDAIAHQKKIDFQCSVPLRHIVGWMDEDKVEKILNNLLSNAFKFTPSGGMVMLSASIDNLNKLILIVKDSGSGISPEDKSRIFEPFFQGQENSNQGTGLGLSLVKQLTTLHLGEVTFESTKGQGTTFKVCIPIDEQVYHQVDKKELKAQSSDGTAKNHAGSDVKKTANSTKNEFNKQVLLLVEDNIDMLEFLSKSFQNEYHVEVATNGMEGFNAAFNLIPDLIISDIMMPIEDGLNMLKRLRENERTSHIPIILLTARGQKDIRMEGFRAGADDFISKPFAVEELVLRVNNILLQRSRLIKKHHHRLVTSTLPVTDSSLDEKFLQRIKQLILQNISDPQFSVERLAEEVNLSRAQLFRKLKGLIGVSPNKLINDMRLQRAADLINAKADTLTQIGYSVGFNEHSYFARRFKEKFGLTPGQYSDLHPSQSPSEK